MWLMLKEGSLDLSVDNYVPSCCIHESISESQYGAGFLCLSLLFLLLLGRLQNHFNRRVKDCFYILHSQSIDNIKPSKKSTFRTFSPWFLVMWIEFRYLLRFRTTFDVSRRPYQLPQFLPLWKEKRKENQAYNLVDYSLLMSNK